MKADESLLRRSLSSSPQPNNKTQQPVVIIVDDDASVREALSELILSAGFQPISFASSRELLDADVLDSPGCLILDVRMPGASGLDLQHRLGQSENPKPIIFLTGHGDIPMSVQAMKAGAVDFFTKPVRDQTLLDAVSAGISMDAGRRAEALIVKHTIERVKRLTPRERDVLHLVVRGRVNKQIAFDLGISIVTVKLHRSNVMRKMEVATIGDLIRAWELLPAPMRETGAISRALTHKSGSVSAAR